jgi:integrase/recombinase XerD
VISVRSLIQPFFAWKEGPTREFAAGSKRKYEPLLLALADWSGERGVETLTTQLLEFEYLPAWSEIFVDRNGRPPAQNTVRLKHNALSSFFDYCYRRGLVPLNPMLAIPRPGYEPRLNDWLSPEEDKALAQVRKTPLEEIVYGLGRLGGLRCGEIVGVRRADVALADDLLHVYGAKSAESVRSVVVFPELAEMIERWLAHQEGRVAGCGGFLVRSASGSRLSQAYVWRIVKRLGARAGVRLHGIEGGQPLALDRSGENLSEISPHTLRRTYGSDLLNRGVRIEVVSAQLGHASVRVTEQAYAKLRTATQREEILRLGRGLPFLLDESRAGAKRSRRYWRAD